MGLVMHQSLENSILENQIIQAELNNEDEEEIQKKRQLLNEKREELLEATLEAKKIAKEVQLEKQQKQKDFVFDSQEVERWGEELDAILTKTIEGAMSRTMKSNAQVLSEFNMRYAATDDLIVVGTVDLVMKEGDQVVLKEYKSTDKGIKNSLLQIQLYLYLYEKIHQVRPAYGILESLESGVQIKVQPSDSTVAYFDKVVSEFKSVAVQTSFSTSSEFNTCKRCDYNIVCPFTKYIPKG